MDFTKLMLTNYEIHVEQEESIRKIKRALQEISTIAPEINRLMQSNQEKAEIEETFAEAFSQRQQSSMTVGVDKNENSINEHKLELVNRRIEHTKNTMQIFAERIGERRKIYKDTYANLSWAKEREALKVEILGSKIKLDEIMSSIVNLADSRKIYEETIVGPSEISTVLDIVKLSAERSNSESSIKDVSRDYNEKLNSLKSLREEVSRCLMSNSRPTKKSDSYKPDGLGERPRTSSLTSQSEMFNVRTAPHPNNLKDVFLSYKSLKNKISLMHAAQNSNLPRTVSMNPQVQTDVSAETLLQCSEPTGLPLTVSNPQIPSPVSELSANGNRRSVASPTVGQRSRSSSIEPKQDHNIPEKKNVETVPSPKEVDRGESSVASLEPKASSPIVIDLEEYAPSNGKTVEPRIIEKSQARPPISENAGPGPSRAAGNVAIGRQKIPPVKRSHSKTPSDLVPKKVKQGLSMPVHSSPLVETIDLTSEEEYNESLAQARPTPTSLKKPNRLVRRMKKECQKNVTFEAAKTTGIGTMNTTVPNQLSNKKLQTNPISSTEPPSDNSKHAKHQTDRSFFPSDVLKKNQHSQILPPSAKKPPTGVSRIPNQRLVRQAVPESIQRVDSNTEHLNLKQDRIKTSKDRMTEMEKDLSNLRSPQEPLRSNPPSSITYSFSDLESMPQAPLSPSLTIDDFDGCLDNVSDNGPKGFPDMNDLFSNEDNQPAPSSESFFFSGAGPAPAENSSQNDNFFSFLF